MESYRYARLTDMGLDENDYIDLENEVFNESVDVDKIEKNEEKTSAKKVRRTRR